ncbi:DUF4230 domain-containing protein [Catellatospora citrea]|uniref:DUF4230 domain-containing protein n=1 Tax=Catellatospora citrea TaxID=53366 RepID=A0A8J3KM09_9ACTN|nr:DUF4230 domain-containing protein [Catellatospora citrea]RKE09250.1 uncharacterized protein DUF4230 [Catellatospora citrea]GIF99570.1 hypothetical protein Cci01nite_46640 [Catellatospora citrea]
MGAADEPTQNLPEFKPGRSRPTEPLPRQRPDDEETVLVEPPRRSRLGRAFLALVVVLGVLAGGYFGLTAAGLIPKFGNPFAERTTDNSQPPLLLSIKDLSRFVAAEGNFEVIVDLKEDRKFIPDWLLNQRTLFVAAGTVEAYVDFSNVSDDKIVVSPDRKSVTITLPAPQVAEPKLDLDRSYVFAEERGLINRVGEFFDGDPNRQQETLLRAEQQLADAAKKSTLQQRAEENTRKTLESMMRSLGYTSVTVIFDGA